MTRHSLARYASVPGLIRVVVLAMASCCAHAGARALEPQDLFQMHWVSEPQIRNDGTLIVYVRNHNDIMTDDVTQSLWLVDTMTGAQTPLTHSWGHYGSPRWSPDGSQIAYVATDADGKAQIVVHWVHGATATLTHLIEAPSDLTWSPDGKRIGFIMLTPTLGPSIGKPATMPAGAHWAAGPVVINDLNFRSDGSGIDPHGYRHLYVVAVEGGGAPRELTFGSYSEAGPLAWSPDGQSIYFAGNRDDNWKREPEDWARHTSMVLSIYSVNLADGTLTQLSHELGPCHAPRVSPDGKLIAYLGYQDKHLGNQNVRLNVMGADGKNTHVVGESLDRSIVDHEWSADGRSLYVQYDDHGMTKIARMGLDGRLENVVSNLADMAGPDQLPYSGGEFTVSGKGVIAYSGGDSGQLPEVYLAKDGRTQRLSDLNSELFADVTVGALSALPVKSSFDGRNIDAWEVLPTNFDASKKYPLILDIHGGPYASYGPVYSMNYQLYAAAGYITVYGNPRGSTSSGEDFANTIHNNYPSHDYDDLMSIVDAAITRGGVDADNLFVTGSSGGGVLTTWIVGMTHRFRAAVTQRPVVNWTSWLLTADMGSFGARYWFKKLPWEDQDTYWKLSPISLIGNVTTPTMVVVGLSDLRTTVSEAEQYYGALQLKGVPTMLYEIPGAAHRLIRPSQFAEEQSAIIEWFDRYRTTAKH
jgi:dipeptidyl aminopeptidase/acylaminoacyl peptidase